MKKYQKLAQENMDKVAQKFFKPERQFIDEELVLTSDVIKPYRQWIYFISKKQVDWLIREGGDLVHPMPYGKKFARGSFAIDGKSYGWEFHTIKGGAAQYKVTLFLDTEIEANKEQE